MDVGASDRGRDREIDKKFVGMSTTDKIGSCGLVHSRTRFRKLFMVLSSGGDGDNYGNDCGNRAQEDLRLHIIL